MKKVWDQDKIDKAREMLMGPWTKEKAFVILWGIGDGSNKEQNQTEGTQNQIEFDNTEKSQINAIAKILNLENRIHPYKPKDTNHKKRYCIKWSDQILSDYLHKIGFRIKKTDVGAQFPEDFPNHLIDVGAYGNWLANGGITRGNGINARIYFSACKEFLQDFQSELELHIGFPGDVGVLKLDYVSEDPDVIDLYILKYHGMYSYRVLSAMFKRTGNICYSEKRDKTIDIVSNYTNNVLDRRDKAKKPKPCYRLKKFVALYDALDLMDLLTRDRYLDHCGDDINKIKVKAKANWYLRR